MGIPTPSGFVPRIGVNLISPVAVSLTQVSKKYQRPAARLSTTLKSYLLKDLWRRITPGAASATASDTSLWVLRDLDLQIHAGKTTGIIGRNGSGKSTLLKLMGRILAPDRGQIRIEGKVAALIELGAGFHPELTGRENILINGVILGQTKAMMRQAMDSIIAFAELGDYIDYPVRTYSSGMYARLGFAVAIHVDPDILLVDEVLSVGDIRFTQKCQAALQRFKDAGKSIVVVSHDLHTIRDWCDEVIWLQQGGVRAHGEAKAVVDAYTEACSASPMQNSA